MFSFFFPTVLQKEIAAIDKILSEISKGKTFKERLRDIDENLQIPSDLIDKIISFEFFHCPVIVNRDEKDAFVTEYTALKAWWNMPRFNEKPYMHRHPTSNTIIKSIHFDSELYAKCESFVLNQERIYYTQLVDKTDSQHASFKFSISFLGRILNRADSFGVIHHTDEFLRPM